MLNKGENRPLDPIERLAIWYTVLEFGFAIGIFILALAVDLIGG